MCGRTNRPDIWTQAIGSKHCKAPCKEGAVHIWVYPKRQSIRSPGAYLKGMTSRAQNGELHLSHSLWGLARQEHAPRTGDA